MRLVAFRGGDVLAQSCHGLVSSPAQTGGQQRSACGAAQPPTRREAGRDVSDVLRPAPWAEVISPLSLKYAVGPSSRFSCLPTLSAYQFSHGEYWMQGVTASSGCASHLWQSLILECLSCRCVPLGLLRGLPGQSLGASVSTHRTAHLVSVAITMTWADANLCHISLQSSHTCSMGVLCHTEVPWRLLSVEQHPHRRLRNTVLFRLVLLTIGCLTKIRDTRGR